MTSLTAEGIRFGSISSYRIRLIDKNGKIVSAAAPRPSDTEALTRAIDALLE